MNEIRLRPACDRVRTGNRVRLLATQVQPKLAGLALVMVATAVLSGCSGIPVSSRASATQEPVCAQKVVQSITTDRAVTGVWACLDSRLQSTLSQYIAGGMLLRGDAVFTDGQNSTPIPGTTTTFDGVHDGIALYTAVIPQKNSAALRVVLMIWLDPNGLISNLNIGTGLY